MHAPRRLKSQVLSRHPFLELIGHELELPGGGSRDVLTLAMPDWVAIAAVTPARELVLVRQHRHGIDGLTLEPAGGLVDPGEEPEAAALRELLEETGYAGEAVESLGWVHPNPALQDNRCHLFLAREVRPVTAPLRSEDEHTEVVLLGAGEVPGALQDGRVTHALAVLALMRALERIR